MGVRGVCVHRCSACGFRQVRPRLGADEITQLYSSDYFDASSSVGYADYAREHQRRQRDAYFLRRWLEQLGGRGRLLEVVCALGFLLAGLKRSTWQVAGVDASPFAVYYARTRYGLDVAHGTLEEQAFPDEAFDVLIQKDLLEHVANPRRHLQESHRILRRGGWLRLVTPNGEANLRPLVGAANGPGRDLRPALDQGHLSFFSQAHLRELFRACGFHCHRIRMIGISRGMRALGWLPGQNRFVRRVSSDSSPGRVVSPVTASIDAHFGALATQIDDDIARRHHGVKDSVLYYWIHRFSKQLDALPAWCEFGYDFECLLQKR